MIDLHQITDFENNVLHLENSMIPLSSSYNSPEKENSNSGEKTSSKDSSDKNITNEGGRPQKEVEERSDKTDRNLEGQT